MLEPFVLRFTAAGSVLVLCLSGCGDDDPSGSGADPNGGGVTISSGPSTSPTGTTAATGATDTTSTSGTGGGSSTTPIFKMDCEDAPLDCGWGYIPEPSPYYTMTHVEDGGPQGQDVVELNHTPQPDGTGQVQYYTGWVHDGMTPPPQGTTWYARFWFKPISPINWNGTGDVWGTKFFAIADGVGNEGTTRVICNLRDDFGVGSGDSMLINCARNIDGYPNGASGTTIASDVWSFIQVEVRSSSADDVEDAHISMWFNSNDYDAPTSQSGAGFYLDTAGWSNIKLGYYAGTALASDGSVRYQLGGFELDDEFDPNWAQ